MSNLTFLAPEIKAVCSLSITLCCQEGKSVISIAFSYGDYQKLAKKNKKQNDNKQATKLGQFSKIFRNRSIPNFTVFLINHTACNQIRYFMDDWSVLVQVRYFYVY